MSTVIEKQLALALERRLAVFKEAIQSGTLVEDEMQLHAVVYMISELLLPCCCMLTNKDKLQSLLEGVPLLQEQPLLIQRLAVLVYDDLARCNGLG